MESEERRQKACSQPQEPRKSKNMDSGHKKQYQYDPSKFHQEIQKAQKEEEDYEYAESIDTFSHINTMTKQNIINILPEPESNRVSRLEEYSHLPNIGEYSHLEDLEDIPAKVNKVVNNFILEKSKNIIKSREGRYHYMDDYEIKKEAGEKIEPADKKRVQFDYDLANFGKKCQESYRTYPPVKQAFLKMFDLDREKDIREKKRRQNMKRQCFRY